MRGVWPYYIGVQTSTADLSTYGYYNRSFLLSNLSQRYDREDDGRWSNLRSRGELNRLKSKIRGTTQIEPDLKSYSLIENELKNSYLEKVKPIKTTDSDRTVYEKIRESYKNKKDKYSESYKFRELSKKGLDYLKVLKETHLLISIMLGNFDGFEKELSSKKFNKREEENINKTLYWIYKTFDYIAVNINCNRNLFFGTNKCKDLDSDRESYDIFCCLYELYNHLTFTLISYLKDQGHIFYSEEDYNNIMHSIHKVRVGDHNYIQSIPTKSGMDSVTKALCSIQSPDYEKKHSVEIVPIAKNPCVEGVEEIYFEIKELTNRLTTLIPCIMTCISCAQYDNHGNYNIEKIVKSVEKKVQQHKQCALILDTTIQIPSKDPVQSILNNENIKNFINEGCLVVFLAKSFQKYATLGTQKMRAGDLTIIGNKESKLLINCIKTLNKEFNNVFKESEYQWMTHMLKYNSSDEMKYLKKCMDNVDIFLENTTFKDNKKSFGMILTKKDFVNNYSMQNYSFLPTEMQSFGYTFCTASQYPGEYRTRLTIGLEPKSILKEIASNNSDYSTSKIWKISQSNIIKMSTYIHTGMFDKILQKFYQICSNTGTMWEAARDVFIKILLKSIKAESGIFKDFDEINKKILEFNTKEELLEKNDVIKKSLDKLDDTFNNLVCQIENILYSKLIEQFIDIQKELNNKQKENVLKEIGKFLKSNNSIEKIKKELYEKPIDKNAMIEILNINLPDFKECFEKYSNILKEITELQELSKHLELKLKEPEPLTITKILQHIKIKEPRTYFALNEVTIENIPSFKKERMDKYKLLLERINGFDQPEIENLKEALFKLIDN